MVLSVRQSFQPGWMMPTRRGALAALGALPFFSQQVDGIGISDAEGFRAIEKAIWVWNLDWTLAGALGEFARTQGVATLFVSLPQGVRSRLLARDGELTHSIRSLSATGIEMWALAGDPAWLEDSTRLAGPLQEFIELQELHELFHGLHLDVEPHAHPRWRLGEGPRSQLLESFVEFFATVSARTKTLPIEAAVHPAMAQLRLRDGENLLRGIGRHVARMSIMAYRDSAVATFKWAMPAIEALTGTKVDWRVGVLVHKSNENRISFFNVPLTNFRLEMIELDGMLRARTDQQRYRGLAFEDYNGLRNLFGA